MRCRFKNYLAQSMILFAVICFVLIVVPMSKAANDPIELKFVYMYAPLSAPAKAMEYYVNLINERAKGRVKITTYPGTTLIDPTKAYEGIVTGIADMGNVVPSYIAGRFPANDAGLLPYDIKSGWVYAHALSDWWEKFKPKEYNDTHVLFYAGCGAFGIASKNKPIRQTQDLKAVKIKASGLQGSAYAKAYGMVPVSLTMGESYDAISKGVVDALIVPPEALQSFKFGDVTRYFTKLPAAFANPNVTVMNLKKWNSLPPDIQKIFTDAAKEGLEAEAKAWWYGDIKGEEYFLGLGGDRKVIEIKGAEAAEWEKLGKTLKEEYIAKHKTLPAAQYINYLTERIAYWNSRHINRKDCIDFVDKTLMKK